MGLIIKNRCNLCDNEYTLISIEEEKRENVCQYCNSIIDETLREMEIDKDEN